MSELRELYQEVILDHNRNPRNHRIISDANLHACGFNPLCGDKLTLYLCVHNGLIDDVSFIGCGCAISQASASLMTEALHGKTVAEAHALFVQFYTVLTGTTDLDDAIDFDPVEHLGKLGVLVGIREFPARVKCATLAWRTLEAALNKTPQVISTE